jgi:ligand-binding sensor domain-containing protein
LARSILEPWPFVLLILAALTLAAQPLQKFRTFFPADSAAAPAALRTASSKSATATDGAVWTVAERGVIRTDPKAPPEDRVQYFNGLRYLPDDDVSAIVTDASRGVWVRTKTGISHIELKP